MGEQMNHHEARIDSLLKTLITKHQGKAPVTLSFNFGTFTGVLSEGLVPETYHLASFVKVAMGARPGPEDPARPVSFHFLPGQVLGIGEIDPKFLPKFDGDGDDGRIVTYDAMSKW